MTLYKVTLYNSFEMQILTSKVSATNATEDSEEIPVKKDFVKFAFLKRKEKYSRVTFTCNGCQKFNHFLSVLAWVRVDNNPENYVYTLDAETLPASSAHVCVTSGIEDLVKLLEMMLRRKQAENPSTLNQSVRWFNFTFILQEEIDIRAL